MKIPCVLAAIAVLGLGSPALAAPGPIKVSDAWCRAAPAGASSAGCYLTLSAARADSLKSVSTPAAERVEIHDMDMSGGMMRMNTIDVLPLPAGRPVALQPGAMHLMLIRPKGALASGSAVPITLRFGKAAPMTVKAPVTDDAPGPHAHQ